MKKRSFILFALAITFFLSCNEKPKEQSNKEQIEKLVKTEVPIKKQTLFTKNKVDSVFQQWLNAQNQGKFDIYSSLYAQKFEGIKRSGVKVYNFDQSGWLKDRKRMFRKQMLVEASDINIKTYSSFGIVRFTQKWSSGSYSDKGPKVLHFYIENNQLKIGKEEMLSSSLLDDNGENINSDFNVYLFNDNNSMVVRRINNVEHLASEAFTNENFELAANPKTEDLEESDKALIGQIVKVYKKDGTFVEAKINSLQVVAKVIPHFGQAMMWEQEQISEEQQNDEIWDMAIGAGMYLIANLDITTKNAAFAIPLSNPEPIIYLKSSDKSDDNSVLNKMSEMPIYKELQSEFESYEEGYEGISWIEANSEIAINYFTNPNSQGQYIIASINVGAGCGDFYGNLIAVYKKENNILSLMVSSNGLSIAEEYIFGFNPIILVDIDLDGIPEIIGKDRIFIFKDGEYIEFFNILEAYFDCPC